MFRKRKTYIYYFHLILKSIPQAPTMVSVSSIRCWGISFKFYGLGVTKKHPSKCLMGCQKPCQLAHPFLRQLVFPLAQQKPYVYLLSLHLLLVSHMTQACVPAASLPVLQSLDMPSSPKSASAWEAQAEDIICSSHSLPHGQIRGSVASSLWSLPRSLFHPSEFIHLPRPGMQQCSRSPL